MLPFPPSLPLPFIAPHQKSCGGSDGLVDGKLIKDLGGSQFLENNSYLALNSGFRYEFAQLAKKIINTEDESELDLFVANVFRVKILLFLAFS